MKDGLKNLKEWKGIIAFVLGCVLIITILLYEIVIQTSENMEEETTDHLEEIADLTKKHIDTRTRVSWDVVQNVEEMLGILEEDSQESIYGYMEYEKNVWGFKHIFLLTEKQTCYDESGNEKEFEVDRSRYERMSRGEYLNVVGRNQKGQDVIYYMRATEPVKYKDTYINGIGISFLLEDLLKEIDVSVLESKGNCYIVDTEGECIVHINSKNEKNPGNILEKIKRVTNGKDEKDFMRLEKMLYDREAGSVFIDNYYIKSIHPFSDMGILVI